MGCSAFDRRQVFWLSDRPWSAPSHPKLGSGLANLVPDYSGGTAPELHWLPYSDPNTGSPTECGAVWFEYKSVKTDGKGAEKSLVFNGNFFQFPAIQWRLARTGRSLASQTVPQILKFFVHSAHGRSITASLAVLLLCLQFALPEVHLTWGHQHETDCCAVTSAQVCEETTPTMQAAHPDNGDCALCLLLQGFGHEMFLDGSKGTVCIALFATEIVIPVPFIQGLCPDVLGISPRGPPSV